MYGDYAPHTAMMRSFSRGNNFPTQYPHYGGQDVKYIYVSVSGRKSGISGASAGSGI